MGSLAVVASVDSALRLFSPRDIDAVVAVVAVVGAGVKVGVSVDLTGDLNGVRFAEIPGVADPEPVATGDLNGRMISRELGGVCGTAGCGGTVAAGIWFSFTVGGKVVLSVVCCCFSVVKESGRDAEDKPDLRLCEGAADRCIVLNVEMRMSRGGENEIKSGSTSDSFQIGEESKMVAFRVSNDKLKAQKIKKRIYF